MLYSLGVLLCLETLVAHCGSLLLFGTMVAQLGLSSHICFHLELSLLLVWIFECFDNRIG
jgi:hypothetical protein